MPWSGAVVDLTDPDPETLFIEDIALSLSNICRWGGHLELDQWYSVAEHSIHVSRELPSDLALEGLLHDASEAYIGDVIKPLKDLPQLQGYREIECAFENAIAQKFGLRRINERWPELVHVADRNAQEIECVNFRRYGSLEHLRGVANLGIGKDPMSRQEAHDEFLQQYNRLRLQRLSLAATGRAS